MAGSAAATIFVLPAIAQGAGQARSSISDWVESSYELHGKGRLWRVRAKDPAAGRPRAKPRTPDEAVTTVASKAAPHADDYRSRRCSGSRTPIRYQFHAGHRRARAAEKCLLDRFAVTRRRSQSPRAPWRAPRLSGAAPQSRRPRSCSENGSPIRTGRLRRAALQWISEEHLDDLRPQSLDANARPTAFPDHVRVLPGRRLQMVDERQTRFTRMTIKQTREDRARQVASPRPIPARAAPAPADGRSGDLERANRASSSTTRTTTITTAKPLHILAARQRRAPHKQRSARSQPILPAARNSAPTPLPA